MRRKIIATFLAVACMVGSLTACNDGGATSTTTSSSTGSVQNGVYTPTALTSNGVSLSEYKIVKSSNASECESYAAEEFRDYIKEATDVTLPIITDATAKSGNEVVIGQTNRSICQNVDYEALGEEGYTLKTSDNDLLIAANETRGVLYGVYTYLEKLGYRFFTKDVENIPSRRKVFIAKDLEETYVPRLEYRDILYEVAYGGEIAPKLKINTAFCQYDLQNDKKYGGCVGYVYDERGFIHTMRYLVSDSYISTNPEYFALWNGERVNGQWGGHCYSCEELVDVVTPVALKWIETDPERQTISISHNDGGVWCQCELCMENYEKYGKSGLLLRFVNQVAKKIGEVYPDIDVELISYGFAVDPPQEGMTLEDNVTIRLCMDYCNIAQHQETGCDIITARKERLEGWAALTDNLRIYMYGSDYFDWFSVLPNINTLYEQIKFFVSTDVVKGLYHEGYSGESPEFGELRAYLVAKMMWNPDMTKEEFNYHMNDFMKGYYGDGWKYIKEYIDYTEEIASKHTAAGMASGEIPSGIINGWYVVGYRFLGHDDYFLPVNLEDFTMFNKWNELWDKAEAEADIEQLERIKKSRVAPTFFELSYTMDYRILHGTQEEQDELMARNEELYKTIIKNGLTQKAEHYYIRTDVEYFTRSPKTWVYKK